MPHAPGESVDLATAHPSALPFLASQNGQPAKARVRPGRGQGSVLAAIALGGGLGSATRYLLFLAAPSRPGHFPLGTFSINVTGCFVLGLLMVFVLDVWPPRRHVRPFLGIGVIGGYTTFSTFAVEVRDLASQGALTLADAYALDSLVGGLAAIWCGMALGRLIARRPVRRARARGSA